MATIIAVHGTFAHVDNEATSVGATVEKQWWEPGSTFVAEMGALLTADTGDIRVVHHKWSGDNSELGRRNAGSALLAKMRELEQQGEPYCAIGHSHGGSVIAAALLQAAARKEILPNLKRWITVGTPFVAFKKEPWLFTRLNLLGKTLFVASIMLLLMFGVYLTADLFSGENQLLFGRTFPGILIVMGLMMSLPALIFYAILYYFDSRSLLLFRKSVLRRARENFASRWLSLAHADDEAIQGLGYLPTAKLVFFNKSFAVRTTTAISVFALPLLYLTLLFSPSAMLSIADWLKTEVYESRSTPAGEMAVREITQQLRAAREQAIQNRIAGSADGETPASRREIWESYRAKRAQLEAKYPELSAIERTIRFKQRFFEEDRKPCPGNQLCGGGESLRINSALLLHVVTDELSWQVGGGQSGSQWMPRLWSIILPVVLVPVIFGTISLFLMLVIYVVSIGVSRLASSLFNDITNSEVRRAGFGNDTEGEVAIGAQDRPVWIEKSPTRLPSQIGDLVTEYSNSVASQSLAKFRRAIGKISSAEPKHSADSAIATYFTWKELVHSSYFDVPEFRKLVAQAVSRAEGFGASMVFKVDRVYASTGQWLAEIEGTPGTAGHVSDKPPTEADVAAVSAAIASTVKKSP